VIASLIQKKILHAIITDAYIIINTVPIQPVSTKNNLDTRVKDPPPLHLVGPSLLKAFDVRNASGHQILHISENIRPGRQFNP